jgi:site-specific DNA-methyltransferase (adenine-specific)
VTIQPYYSDERATLYRGDALGVLAALPDASVDALVTDPPYSSGGMVRGDRAGNDTKSKYSGYAGKQPDHAEFSGDNRDQRGYAYWLALWLGESLRVVKPGGVALLFTDWRQLPSTTDAIQAGGYVWRGIVPWYKPVSRPTSGRFTANCEYVVWGSAGPMPTDDLSAPCFPGFYQASPPRDREHLTQKPVDVMRSLVKIVPVGGVVLDPFMGSGTTGVAAMIEGRGFIGAEMTEHYAEIAERRIRTAAGQAIGKGDQDALDFGASA